MGLKAVEMFIGHWLTGDFTTEVINLLSANFMKYAKSQHLTVTTAITLSKLITALFITVSEKFIKLDL